MTVLAREDWEYQDLDEVPIPDEACEKWTEADGLPPGYVAWAQHDVDAESPRSEYDTIAKFCNTDRHYDYDECVDLRALLDRASERGWSDEKTIKIARRMGAYAIERFDFGTYGQGTMWAWVAPDTPITKLLGSPKYASDPVEWLEQADSREALVEAAEEALKSEIAIYKMWDEGDVYVVTAMSLRTGKDWSLCGCYDEWPYKYLREVADDLIKELS